MDRTLTLEVWVAVDSYPVSDAAFVNQHSYPSAGYFFGLNKYGFWGLGLSVRDSLPWHECWAPLPVALVPEPGVDQQGCWSGSSTINRGVPTIVYTGGDGEKATICIATSQDDMRSWKKYSGNPIIASPPAELHAKEFRDPFVWNEGEVFYMIIGSGIADVGGTALLYKSQDMIHWQFLKPLLVGNKKDSGVFWEMPVFGRVGDKHILMVTEVPARDSYWIGTWKNETFIPDSVTPRRLELVNHYLSPSIRPDQQGRLVAIGIIPETRLRSELFAAGWAHVFGLPRVLSLTPDGQLKQEPLPELAMLRESHRRFEDVLVSSDAANVLHGLEGDSLEIVAEFTERKALRFGLKLRRSPDAKEETTIFYDTFNQSLNIDRARSSINPAVERNVRGGRFELGPESLMLHVFLDHSAVEVFVNGRATFTSRIYPTRPDSRGVDVFAEDGVVRLKSLDVWSIKSIWT